MRHRARRPLKSITPEMVEEIRKRSGVMTSVMIAYELGISQASVSHHQKLHNMPRLTPVQGRAINREYFS